MLVATGGATPVLVLEGRQPATMATYVSELGKNNVLRIYLQCSFLEQAIRFVEREVDEHAGATIRRHLQPNMVSFGSASNPSNVEELIQWNREIRTQMSKLDIANISQMCDQFEKNQMRDYYDLQRFCGLYGKEMDFHNREFYDIVIDTTPNTSQQTFQQAHAAIQEKINSQRFLINTLS
eukprot:TRINITY_DN1122_c0_g3_i1.p1 TRINITY_DN1122_c0_g3~~TRINITY_DN1122_c0_g3_i1.p1  ORF type:complete len:180 (+),score=31.18 TRINITY_DN1122_c0_g3_i1:436-975(+)